MLLSSGPFHFENVNAGGRKSLVVGPADRADHGDVEMRFKFRIFLSEWGYLKHPGHRWEVEGDSGGLVRIQWGRIILSISDILEGMCCNSTFYEVPTAWGL